MRTVTLLDDGFSASAAPASGATVAADLNVYANDAAYVSNHGTAAEGNIYGNSGTGAPKYYTGAAWEQIAAESNEMAMTNKSFDDEIGHKELASGATAASGYRNLYPKTDGTYAHKDDAGSETLIPLVDASSATNGQVPQYDSGSDTGFTLATPAADQVFPGLLKNFRLAISSGSGALTVALKDADGNDPSSSSKVRAAFRSATATSDDYSVLERDSALSLTLSSGSTLGFASGQKGLIYVGLVDADGTEANLELVLCRQMYNEANLQSCTAEGGVGAADSLSTIYATSSHSNRPIRWLGVIEVTPTTAGTHDTGDISKLKLYPFQKQQFYRLTELASMSRVTGAAPDALGEYRSYRRQGSANTFTETDAVPGTTPTVADGFLIYAGTAWASINPTNEPTRYDLFVGYDKKVRAEFYANSGRSQMIDCSCAPNEGSGNSNGYAQGYNPSSGLFTIVAPANSNTDGHNSGVLANGAQQDDCYFDLVIEGQPD